MESRVWAHSPRGVVFPAYQFPPGSEPQLDGDLAEWDGIPEEYVIRPWAHVELNRGEELTDLGDLNLRIVVGWSESANRLYFMMERYDDVLDRDCPVDLGLLL